MIGRMVVAGLVMLASAGPLAAPSPGPGGGSGGGPQATGSQEGENNEKVSVTLKDSRIVVSGNGTGGKSDGYRVKRPCWYEPGGNAEEMLKKQEGSKPEWIPETEWRRHLDDLKQFKDKVGKEGTWWTRAYNAADPNALSCLAGLEPYVFVPPNTTPPAGITVRELADIARAALTVPKPKIEVNPDVKSYVNLDTWVWLGDIGPTTRSVTATLPGVMSATVTATLGRLEIKSGTTKERADVRQDCAGGGKPYGKGKKDDEFSCGVTYRRASADQPRGVYTMTVTAVWPVTAPGVDFDYAPVQMSADRDVVVGEVQSVVKGGE
ncbi:hypothetical protein ACFQ08_29305 [Streptosporangium algeriense]|uniref:Enoyl reductase n=1 Tax=Streptosporangium algeriense TaxID=1682748 RepID=A0ABW3E121_9ACTN